MGKSNLRFPKVDLIFGNGPKEFCTEAVMQPGPEMQADTEVDYLGSVGAGDEAALALALGTICRDPGRWARLEPNSLELGKKEEVVGSALVLFRGLENR